MTPKTMWAFLGPFLGAFAIFGALGIAIGRSMSNTDREESVRALKIVTVVFAISGLVGLFVASYFMGGDISKIGLAPIGGVSGMVAGLVIMIFVSERVHRKYPE